MIQFLDDLFEAKILIKIFSLKNWKIKVTSFMDCPLALTVNAKKSRKFSKWIFLPTIVSKWMIVLKI